MPFKTSLWIADGGALKSQDRVVLDSEKRLEDWIVADLSLLGEDLLLIGRQIRTTGGPLDILAIDSEGTLVIAELKRDKTPREVVSQVLDYASWISGQSARDIDALCVKLNNRSLADAFREHFDAELPEQACSTHRMLIVAAELDESSERIVRYLQDEHEIGINAVFFSVFRVENREVLVRAWLADPEETQQRAERREKVPWSGVWFVNVGIDDSPTNFRDWELCRRFGFLSAGGGEKYSRPLRKLAIGDRLAAYEKGRGYVGIGTVTKTAAPVDDFVLEDGKPLSSVSRLRGSSGQPKAEYAVGIAWSRSVPEAEAKTFAGVFANQNVVCKLRDPVTLEFLTKELGL